VEEGFDAVLVRKHSPASAKPRIFDSTFRRRRRSYSYRTISTFTSRPHSTKPFPPPEARRLVEKFEWHYTPKHGS
jgi:hypothetical protein